MADYETILIPTDGSTPAERGIEHGLGIARDNDATIHFVQILNESRYGWDAGAVELRTCPRRDGRRDPHRPGGTPNTGRI